MFALAPFKSVAVVAAAVVVRPCVVAIVVPCVVAIVVPCVTAAHQFDDNEVDDAVGGGGAPVRFDGCQNSLGAHPCNADANASADAFVARLLKS